MTGLPKTPPMEAPCNCLTVHHEHGDVLRYKDGCRCDKCRAGEAARAKYRYRMVAYGTWQPNVNPVGARRRLEALMTVGWPVSTVADMCGMRQTFASRLMRTDRHWVYLSTHQRIAAIYEEMWDKTPPETTSVEKHRANRARNTARSRGYAPPMAWDDIDDPAAVPAAAGQSKQRAGDRYEELLEIGYTLQDIAYDHRITVAGVLRAMERREVAA